MWNSTFEFSYGFLGFTKMYFVKIEEGNKKEKELSNTITKMPSIIQFICITKISEVNANFSAIR